MDVAKKLVGGTLGLVSLAVDGVRHVAWLISYYVDRTSRDPEDR